MRTFPAVGAFALVLLATACSQETTSPLSRVDQSALDAKGDIIVTSQIFGDATNPMSIQSDGGGAYTNSNGVASIIQPIGDWVLDLTARRSTRRVQLNLTDALSGNPLAAPFSVATVPVRFISKATEFGNRFQDMIGVGSTILSPLSVGQIAYGGKEYAIRMNTNNHPATEWALVTCTGVTSTNACNQWRLTPTGSHDGASKNIGRLEQITSAGPVFIGYFYFSFDIVVTR